MESVCISVMMIDAPYTRIDQKDAVNSIVSMDTSAEGNITAFSLKTIQKWSN